jgi:glycosyltransferase involved in cell wall biosynthesis
MRILLLATSDRGGGAQRVAVDMLRLYRAGGHDARMLVRYKHGSDPAVSEADPYMGAAPWAPALRLAERMLKQAPAVRGTYRARDWLRRTALPQRWADRRRGVEDFNYPYAHRLADAGPWQPDVIHAHNLHGDYFDLSALATLSARRPVVWTLHDAWALTGHCAYPIDCPRWRSGCGACPDLRRPPAVRRDATAENWRRKREIYAASSLAVATPSRWLMGLVDQSGWRPAQRRVVPNGVDRTVFQPGDQRAARAALGLPSDAFICMFVAYGATRNPYKDLTTVERAVRLAGEALPDSNLRFICVGGAGGQAGDTRISYTGHIADQRCLAQYYRAADLLLHAARADTFPLVVLEALACGTPVIATDVGGVGEQIVAGESGWLVPLGDSAAMAERLSALAADPAQTRRLGAAAAERAAQHFSLDAQAASYLGWFAQLLPERSAR